MAKSPNPNDLQKAFPEAVVRPVPAISRTFAILRYMATSDEPIGVHACARAAGLVPSTCLHILRALVAEKIVSFDRSTKRYSLGTGLLTIGNAVLRKGGFLRAVQADLDQLSESYGVTVVLANIVDGDHSVIVALSHGDQAMRYNVSVGSRYPALIGASGRCFAAFSGIPHKEIMRRVNKLKWARKPNPEVGTQAEP